MDSIADDTRWLDATAQAELVASKEVTAVELVEAAAARIEELDGALNAVVVRWFDEARAAASESAVAGPFAGVPFLLKDLWAHESGRVLTNGNKALAAAQPVSDHDSDLVRRFREAGLVTMGRSSSPEFGTLPVTETEAYGATRNPWDTGRTCGGSSGGAGAAVAAGLVPIAHASDGGGSIRIPASCTGLVGLKPSQGRIGLGPERAETGLGVDFCVSRSIRDTAALLDAVAVPGVGDTVIAPRPERPYVDEVGADPGSLRIGVLDHDPRGVVVADVCRDAARSTATLLEELGHRVDDAHPAILGDDSFAPRFLALWAVGRATAVDGLEAVLGRPAREDEVEPVNWVQAEYARSLTAVEYAESLQAIVEYRRSIQQWWADGYDLLVTPTLAQPPLPIGALYDESDGPIGPLMRAGDFVPFTPPFNTSGQPAISLPLATTADGLPVGVQLVAAYGREDVLIRVASQLEAARPWAERRPSP